MIDKCLNVIVLVGAGYVFKRVYPYLRTRSLAEAGRRRTLELREDADAYECDVRDALETEESDVTIESVVQSGEDVLAIDEAGVSRGPATRRIARKQKSVHVDGKGCVISEKYFGSVVAEARIVYKARGYSEYNAELARAFMVRVMKKHGVRPSQIDDRLEDMVTAVFYLTDKEKVTLERRKAMETWGMMWQSKVK